LIKARDSSQGSDIDYKQCDIQQLSRDGSVPQEWHHAFDKVFTSATLHWCKADPAGVVESVKWLLKPGGVFAYEFGGYNNA
jgi:SAM-dependent methyltransferase